jgi:hypothetical protein
MSAKNGSLVISAGDGGLPWPPTAAAQLTRISTRPNSPSTWATAALTAASAAVSATRGDLWHARFCGSGLERGTIACNQGDLHTLPCKLPRDSLADAAVAASYDRDLIPEFQIQRLTFQVALGPTPATNNSASPKKSFEPPPHRVCFSCVLGLDLAEDAVPHSHLPLDEPVRGSVVAQIERG